MKSFGVETSGSVAKCRLFSQASCVAAITKTERRPGHIDDSIRVACFGYWEMAIEQWHLGILGTNNSFLAPTSQCSKQPFLARNFFRRLSLGTSYMMHGTCLSCVLDRLTVLAYFTVQLLGLLELLGLLVRDSVLNFDSSDAGGLKRDEWSKRRGFGSCKVWRRCAPKRDSYEAGLYQKNICISCF